MKLWTFLKYWFKDQVLGKYFQCQKMIPAGTKPEAGHIYCRLRRGHLGPHISWDDKKWYDQ